MSDRHVRLLWTGGWDSTFQLLRLLLIERVDVQPFYLMREGRPSTEIEIATMERIRTALAELHPHTGDALCETRFVDVSSLTEDPAIAQAYERTLQRRFLGRQYEWLAWFCTQWGIGDIQLCIHRDDKAHALLAAHVVEREDGYVFGSAATDDAVADLRILFRHFVFPVFEMSKLEMADEAERRGWSELMDMTWFCHSPLRSGQPCGICHPCLYTVEEGLAYRLPRWSRTRSAVFRTCLLPFRTPIVAVLEATGLRRRDA